MEQKIEIIAKKLRELGLNSTEAWDTACFLLEDLYASEIKAIYDAKEEELDKLKNL